MKVVEVTHDAGRYPVYIGQDLLAMAQAWERHVEGRVLIVTDETVAELYLARVKKSLGDHRQVTELVLPAGEEHKTIASWQAIIDALVTHRAQRDATVIALGGGVIGDMAGFGAACYMRGIRVVQIPTTLLAQVDAAVGGKTGVNHPSGKNLIGAFHQPTAVVADADVLTSLGDRDYRAGLAEVVKYGAIRDARFFAWLETNAEALSARLPETLVDAVHESVRNKGEVVAADVHEAGERAILNFGHTFAHALETATEYRRYRHGEAVSIGMVLAAKLSEYLGLAPAGTRDRIESLLDKLGLPVTLPEEIDRNQLLRLMRLDKKNRADQIHVVALTQIGEAGVRPCPADDILEILTTS